MKSKEATLPAEGIAYINKLFVWERKFKNLTPEERQIKRLETAKANGLNPYKYLEFLLSRLPGSNIKINPKVLELMMPWDDLIQRTCKID